MVSQKASGMDLVLLADAEPWQRLLMREILSDEPALHIIETGNGQEAHTLALAHRPRVLILDILLPHLDGLSLCSMIKAHPTLHQTWVMILTALRDEARGWAAGCDAFLIRPCEPEMLLDSVRGAVSVDGRSASSDTIRDKPHYSGCDRAAARWHCIQLGFTDASRHRPDVPSNPAVWFSQERTRASTLRTDATQLCAFARQQTAQAEQLCQTAASWTRKLTKEATP